MSADEPLAASVSAPAGFRSAGGACGIKEHGRADLATVVADVPCTAAALFTRSRTPAAPVLVNRRHLRAARATRAIVCNAGVANASTGKRGQRDAERVARHAAGRLGCRPESVLVCSTGLIGARLPTERVLAGVDRLLPALERSADADRAAAHAILTTDTVAKEAVRRIRVGGRVVTVGGIGKGSGMIAPNMGTMLAFLTTDAAVGRRPLARALREAADADASFNNISVDTDTSPSDTVAALASGLADNPPLRSERSAGFRRFVDAVTSVCQELAHQIVHDGEGATRVVRARAEGAASRAEARRVARAVAESPLVKAAVYGGDPNWGRIVTAAAKTGARLDAERIRVRIGAEVVCRRGTAATFDERAAVAAMRGEEVTLSIHLGVGRKWAEVLGPLEEVVTEAVQLLRELGVPLEVAGGVPLVAVGPQLHVDGDGPEQRQAEPLRHGRGAATAEDVVLLPVVADEVAHVLHEAEHLDVELLEHVGGADRVVLGDLLRRARDDGAGHREHLGEGERHVTRARR